VAESRHTLARTAPVGGAVAAVHRRPGVELIELPFVAKLRIQAARRDIERLRAAAGELLPAPSRALGDDPWILWRAPGDFLAYSLVHDVAALESALRERIHAPTAAIRLWRTDVSSLLAFFELRGELAVETLMRGVSLDLEGDALPVGGCTQTPLGPITAALHRVAVGQWRIGVDRSAARWAWEWLVDSADVAAASGGAP